MFIFLLFLYTIKPKMYNLICSLIVLMQHLQLNHSCVFIVVSKVGNRVTIQLASYAKNSIQRLLTILKFSNNWIETTDPVWNNHQSWPLHQVIYFLSIFIRSTCAEVSQMSMSDTGITTPTKVSMQFCFIKLLLHLNPSKTK